MIRATWQYLRDEAAPRSKGIVAGSELWIASFAGIVCATWGNVLFNEKAQVADVASGVLTYTAIALGFCLAGLTLALTLPDREFAKKLAKSKAIGKKHNSYSDLLFVFSWTAICHWIAVVFFLVVIALGNTHEPIITASSSILRRIMIGATSFALVYAVLQFLITLITLSQVGATYINSLSDDSLK